MRFFADGQQQAVIQAISAAEEVITHEQGRKAVIQAARSKVISRSDADAKARREMEGRIVQLADAAHVAFGKLGAEVESSVPGMKARTERSSVENEHSPGSCMSGAFLVHRGGSKEEMATAEFALLPQEPLVLVAQEKPEPQHDRFMKWLEEAVVVALAEWKKQL